MDTSRLNIYYVVTADEKGLTNIRARILRNFSGLSKADIGALLGMKNHRGWEHSNEAIRLREADELCMVRKTYRNMYIIKASLISSAESGVIHTLNKF